MTAPTPMGHEYCGIVEEVGSAVKSVQPGQFLIGSFFASDNTCPHCKASTRQDPTRVPAAVTMHGARGIRFR